MSPRDLQKAMKRLGIKLEEVNAVKVTIELDTGEQLLVEDPQVMIMKAKGQPPMLYITGEIKKVEKKEEEEKPLFTEEDVALVAEQAGVSLEEARKALEETGGDIAEAILKLQQEG
ncbi:MAG: nascent polypeptide-associated complex protein [Desulfurococcales archaeon]|nr:nascent polypeptide-associated complex protein [Desulfurococcales archaeon]